jgi:hypothetical protein
MNKIIDRVLCEYAHLIKNVTARIKHYRIITTDYDKFSINLVGYSLGLLSNMVIYKR